MTSDDGFREIQLSGKQLVFLFMAGTIAVVAIFLFGVMVGRGVRNAAPTGPGGENTTAAPLAEPAPDTASKNSPAAANVAQTPGAPNPAPGGASAAPNSLPPTPPPPPSEDLSYYKRLEGDKAPAESLKKPATAPAGRAGADDAKTPPALAADAPPAESGGGDLAVQVAAFTDQGQADAVVKRLLSKGYPAYVLAPPASGGMFRVRVGKFKEQREAEAVKRRLEKEEQFKPWITR